MQAGQPSRDGIAGRFAGGQENAEKCTAVTMEKDTGIPPSRYSRTALNPGDLGELPSIAVLSPDDCKGS